jgi:hypothetical protein
MAKRTALPAIAFAAIALTATIASFAIARGTTPALTPRHGNPVLVELYQSQGCSSCPPAEANLNAIAGRHDIVALSFGVTYWDYLGWKDIFATPQFTDRQQDYARHNRSGYVATPQVWINGRETLPGNDPAALDRAIGAATSNGPAITIDHGKTAISAGTAPASGGDVWLAYFDPRTVNVAIARGENGGRTLPHRNIVHQLIKLGRWTGPAASYPLPPPPAGLLAAVFVQAGPGGPVLSVARN